MGQRLQYEVIGAVMHIITTSEVHVTTLLSRLTLSRVLQDLEWWVDNWTKGLFKCSRYLISE